MKCARLLSLCLFFLPFLQRLQFFIQPQIALVAAGLDCSSLQGRQHGTALFLGMAAIQKPALPQIGLKLLEGLRQAALQLQIQFFRLKGGEARRIHHFRPAAEAEQLHMAGGMASPPQRSTNLAGFQVKFRVQRIQNTDKRRKARFLQSTLNCADKIGD